MRSRGAMRDHAPDLNALRAAFTAASTSDASPRATSAITSPVAGLMVWNVLPFFEETNLPSMKWRVSGFSLAAALCSAFASNDLACSRFMSSSLALFGARGVVGRANPALLIALRRWPRQSTGLTRMGHAIMPGKALGLRGNPGPFARPDAFAMKRIKTRSDDQRDADPGGDRGPIAEPDEPDDHHPQHLHIDEGRERAAGRGLERLDHQVVAEPARDPEREEQQPDVAGGRLPDEGHGKRETDEARDARIGQRRAGRIV